MPADLAIVMSDSPDPVDSGSQLTYSIEVTNNGPGSAGDVTMTDPLPLGTTFVLCTTGQGTCSGPSVGTNGTVTANLGQLAPTLGGNVTITIVVNVTGAAPPLLSNTATVTSSPPSSTPDPNGADNFATETTTVNP
jgi:uncharacterized repeat protein (TIGR01451 family)